MTKRFTTNVERDARGRVLLEIPFDPNDEWGMKDRHHVRGTVDGLTMRAVIERKDGGFRIALGPAWARDCAAGLGPKARVVLEAEGPQRDDLAPDIAEALDASPKAGAFFDSLAQFYRRAYLRWIDGTKRRPDERARRIGEMVALLEAGKKER